MEGGGTQGGGEGELAEVKSSPRVGVGKAGSVTLAGNGRHSSSSSGGGKVKFAGARISVSRRPRQPVGQPKCHRENVRSMDMMVQEAMEVARNAALEQAEAAKGEDSAASGGAGQGAAGARSGESRKSVKLFRLTRISKRHDMAQRDKPKRGKRLNVWAEFANQFNVCAPRRKGAKHLDDRIGQRVKTKTLRERAQEVWEIVDVNRDNQLNFDEVKAVFHGLHVKVPDREIKQWMNQFDEDKNGTLDFEEFVKMFEGIQSRPDLTEEFLVAKMLRTFKSGQESALGGKTDVNTLGLRPHELREFIIWSTNGEVQPSLEAVAYRIHSLKTNGAVVGDTQNLWEIPLLEVPNAACLDRGEDHDGNESAVGFPEQSSQASMEEEENESMPAAENAGPAPLLRQSTTDTIWTQSPLNSPRGSVASEADISLGEVQVPALAPGQNDVQLHSVEGDSWGAGEGKAAEKGRNESMQSVNSSPANRTSAVGSVSAGLKMLGRTGTSMFGNPQPQRREEADDHAGSVSSAPRSVQPGARRSKISRFLSRARLRSKSQDSDVSGALHRASQTHQNTCNLPNWHPQSKNYEEPMLSYDLFVTLLTNSEHNSLGDPAKIYNVYQDMSQPLSHYFISSSHNSYLSGNQLNSESTSYAIIRALRLGVRVIELDAWNGPHDDPIVTHGNTLCKPMPFKECIFALRDHGFDASEYPVIITIENHCSMEQQRKQIQYLEEILGDKLFHFPTPDENNLKVGVAEWLSPQDLKGKFVIRDRPNKRMTKQDKIELKLQRQELSESTKAASSSLAVELAGEEVLNEEGSGKSPSGRLRKFSFSRSRRNSKRRKSLTKARSSESSSGDPSDALFSTTIPDGEIVTVASSDGTDASSSASETVTGSNDPAGSNQGLPSEAKEPAVAQVDDNNERPGATNSGATKSGKGSVRSLAGSLDRELFEEGSEQADEEKLDAEPDEDSLLLDESTLSRTGSVFSQDEQVDGVIPELLRLMYIKNVSIPLRVINEDVVQYVPFPYRTSSSLSEQKMRKLVTPGPRVAALSTYAKSHLIRVYPAGSRISSSNYDPVPAWNAGCQIVALNYQSFGQEVWLNQGRFLDNGGCGYVLKPEAMLNAVSTGVEERSSSKRSVVLENTPSDEESKEEAVQRRTQDKARRLFGHSSIRFDNDSASRALPWTLKEGDASFHQPRQLTVELISAHYIPFPRDSSKSSVNPYVEITLRGLEEDDKTVRSTFVQKNGFDPQWRETFSFELHNVDLAILSFIVRSAEGGRSKGRFLAQAALPVTCLRQGYRCVPLRYANCALSDDGYIFARFTLSAPGSP
ncbi:1-phosphatidylinositol 4 [Durusdinium trenchii]|uniref:Phosphoinositide phospholipase C n=1 Tax=Durusdinium trenchii TaxID=1381693 RepID=A0ABP0K6L0_9DINO